MIRDHAVSLPRLQEEHPKVRAEIIARIEWVEATAFPDGRTAIRIAQALRTIEYQNSLYAIGRTVKGKNAGLPKHGIMGDIVTKARGGKSYHNYGLAFDFALLYDLDGNGTWESLSWDMLADRDLDGQRDWMEVVNAFKDMNWRWGGDWNSIKDNPHLEKTFNYSIGTLYNMYLKGKFIEGTQYLNI